MSNSEQRPVAARRKAFAEWLVEGLDVKTVIVLVGVLGTNLASTIWLAASLTSRMQAVEIHQVQIDTRLDRDLVPRREHEEKDKMLAQQLTQMQNTLSRIEDNMIRESQQKH